MDPDRWQRQYREAVDELDLRERQWRTTEELLRRIAGRLCIAARGQHAGLDESLNGLIAAFRRPVEAELLEPLLTQLTQSVAALDAPPAAAAGTPAVAAPAGTQTLVQSLARLLDRLEAGAEARALRQRLPELTDAEALAAAALQVAELLDSEAVRLRRDKLDADRLLEDLSQRLEEITRYLRGEESERAEAAADGRAFNQTLLTQTQELYANVHQASDLAGLQQQVRQRLSTIDEHVRAYRSREDARLGAYQQRTEQLRSRVEELENKTQALTHSLQKTERRAFTDALTGVANRQAYNDRIAAELKQWKRDRRARSIAAIDIDHFKLINDQYGHLAGDKVLQVMAQHLSRRLRESDFFARYGGEEFVLLMDDLTVSQALAITDRLRQSVEKLGFHFRRMPVAVTVSCGVAGLREGDTAESLFERADQALYLAKKNGRNQCVAG
jgi:diguanylate cyclase